MARHLAFGWVLLLAASACGNVGDIGQAASDPLLPGPYALGVTSVTFVDPARGRPLLTKIWYPASDDARAFAASPITDFVDPTLAGLLEQSTVPLVGVRFQNIFQVERLASHGFIVVAPDHTRNTLFDIGRDQNSAANRPLDISFLYDVMTEETGDVGGPFAGWVDLAAPGPISASYTAPTCLMLATEDKTIGEGLNEGIRQAYTLALDPLSAASAASANRGRCAGASAAQIFASGVSRRRTGQIGDERLMPKVGGDFELDVAEPKTMYDVMILLRAPQELGVQQQHAHQPVGTGSFPQLVGDLDCTDVDRQMRVLQQRDFPVAQIRGGRPGQFSTKPSGGLLRAVASEVGKRIVEAFLG